MLADLILGAKSCAASGRTCVSLGEHVRRPKLSLTIAILVFQSPVPSYPLMVLWNHHCD